MKQWISGLGRRLGDLFASDDEGAVVRRHRERVVDLGLTRIHGTPPDKEAKQDVLKRQKRIDALHHRLKEDGDNFDLEAMVEFDGLSQLKPFQESERGYILVYLQDFASSLLGRLIKAPKPIASVVFESHEDPAAHIQVLERGHGLAFGMPFFPEDDNAFLCEFFGELTAISGKAATFAIETKAPVLPIWFRLEDDKLTLEIAPALENHTSADGLTLALVEHFERRVRATPAEMDWEADCWYPPTRRLLPSRFPWKLALAEGRTLRQLKPLRILVRVPDTIREACLAIPAVRALKLGRPDTQITVLTTEEMISFWQKVDGCDICLDLSDPDSEDHGFDLGVLLSREKSAYHDLKKHAVTRILGMENHPAADQFDDILTMPRKLGPPEHRNRTHLRIAQRLGAAVEKIPALRAPASPANKPADRLELCFGIAPGSDDGQTYIWPSEYFVKVLEDYLKKAPEITWKIFLNADAPREPWSDLTSPKVTIIQDTETPSHRMNALQGCSLLLANDNDFLHLAAIIHGLPTIALYGPSEPAETAPVAKLSFTLRKHVECTPCFLTECPLDHRCLKEIPPDEAIAALETLEGEILKG